MSDQRVHLIERVFNFLSKLARAPRAETTCIPYARMTCSKRRALKVAVKPLGKCGSRSAEVQHSAAAASSFTYKFGRWTQMIYTARVANVELCGSPSDFTIYDSAVADEILGVWGRRTRTFYFNERKRKSASNFRPQKALPPY